MGSSSTAEPVLLHQALIDHLKERGLFREPEIEAAFREVPRHAFLPQLSPEQVYRNEALPIKWRDMRLVSSSSQPTMMALMLDQLRVEPGQRVLEIGTGTGYNAALLDHLVGPSGAVISLEVERDVAEAAVHHLTATGHQRVQVIHQDGQLGVADLAPFDRILVTAGTWDIPRAWWQQLQIHGRLVLPLSLGGPQASIGFDKVQPEMMRSDSILHCGFVPLQGDRANPQTWLGLECNGSVSQLMINRHLPTSRHRIEQWLQQPSHVQRIAVSISITDLCEGLESWLAMGSEAFCNLQGETELIPRLLSQSSLYRSFGLLGPESLALLVGMGPICQGQMQLGIRTFGPGSGQTHQLLNQIRAWEDHGRPGLDDLQMQAYPQGIETEILTPDILLTFRRPQTQFTLCHRGQG